MADIELQSAEQQKLIEHLKTMIREREESLQKKDAELKESNAKMSKMKLQAKAQVTKLTHQLEDAKQGISATASSSDKTSDKATDDTSKADRGKTKLLQKKLEEKDKIIGEKDEVIKVRESQIETKETILAERETIMSDLQEQLQEKTEAMKILQASVSGESSIDEMYAQIVYKDKKLLELNNKILEQDRQVMDLQEYVSEKNEVIRGRDKVIQILQSSLKDKDQNIQDQAMLIAKLTAKVENSEENISLLTEQLQKKEHDLKFETDRFSLKLSESQKYFEETISEKESELQKLHDSISLKEKDLLTSQNDLHEIINRHERDIQSIMSKDTVNIEDTIMKMMEQKIKDSNEILEGKIKVVEIMQTEMISKDQELTKNREILKTMKDKFQVTSEQLMLLQANFIDMESQWKEEKLKLETKAKTVVEKHETELSEKDLQIQTFQMSLSQYENAYAQASVQYSSLQERYQQAFTELQKVKEGQPQFSQDTSQTAEADRLRKVVDLLKAEVSQKTEEVECLKKSSAEETSASKSDKSETKVLKMKAQMTSKIKNLEKELLQLRQGSNLADEVVTLKNQLVELEDEKGNLQLKLVDFEEQKILQAQLEMKIKELESEKESLTKEMSEISSNLQAANDEREKLSQIVTDLQVNVDENQVTHDSEQKQLVDNLKEQISDLQDSQQILTSELEEVKLSRLNLEKENIELMEYRKQTESDMTSMTEKISELESMVFSLSNSVSEQQEKISSLEAEKVSLEVKMVETEELREGSEIDKENMNLEIKKLKEKIEYEMQPNIAFEKENDELQQKIRDLQHSLQESQNTDSQQTEEITNLKSSLEAKSTELKDAEETTLLLNQQLNSGHQKLQVLDQQLQTSQAEIENLKQDKHMLQQKLDVMEQEQASMTNHLQAKLEDVHGKNEVLEGDVHFYIQQNEEKELRIKELETINGAKNEEIQSLHISLKEKKDSLSDLDLLVKKLTRDLDVAKEGQSEKGVEFEQKSQSLLSQISELESELVVQQKAFTGLQEDVSKLHMELESMKSECESSKVLVGEKESEISLLQSQLRNLSENEKSALDELVSEKEFCRRIDNENISLKSQTDKLESDLLSSQNLSASLSAKCDELSELCATKEQSVGELTSELNDLKSVSLESESVLAELKFKCDQFELLITEKDSQILSNSEKHLLESEDLTSENESLKTELSDVRKQLESKINQLQVQISEKQQTLYELSKSMDSETSMSKCLLDENDSKIKTLKGDLDALSSQNLSLLSTNEQLESSILSSQSLLTEKSDSCLEKDSQIHVLNAGIQDSLLKCSHLEATIHKVLNEKVDLHNQVMLMEKELKDKTEQVSHEEIPSLLPSKSEHSDTMSSTKDINPSLEEYKSLFDKSLKFQDQISFLKEENLYLKKECSKTVESSHVIEKRLPSDEIETAEEKINLEASAIVKPGNSSILEVTSQKTNVINESHISLGKRVQYLESKLASITEELSEKENELKSLKESNLAPRLMSSAADIESSESSSGEVLKLKKLLKKKEARIAVLNKQFSEQLQTSEQTPKRPTSVTSTVDPTGSLQLLDEVNAKLYLEQERRNILEKQLNEFSTERVDLIVNLDKIPILKSTLKEKEIALVEIKKINSKLVNQNNELIKRLNMEQKTAETDSEFSRHLQAMLISKSSKLDEQTENIDEAEQREEKTQLIISMKDNEIQVLRQEVMNMTETLIDKESLHESVKSKVDYYEQQLSILQQDIINMGDTYSEQLNQVNENIFEFMKNYIRIPRIVIEKDNLVPVHATPAHSVEQDGDLTTLKEKLQLYESENFKLREKEQKSQIQLQYEKDLAQSMSTRYKEEVKEISELRSEVHRLRKKVSASENAEEDDDDDDSTLSSNEHSEQYGRAEIIRLTEILEQAEHNIRRLTDQKRDLEMELDDLVGALHRKDDMLFQTKDELNSNCNFIDDLEADMRDKDEELRSLKEILSKSQTDIFHLREEVEYRDNLLGNLSPRTPSSRAQSVENLDEVSSLQKTMKKKDARILVLNKKIKELEQKSEDTDGLHKSQSNDGVMLIDLQKDKLSLEKLLKEKESQIQDLEAQVAVSERSSDVVKLKKLLKKREAKILVLTNKLDEVSICGENSLNTSVYSETSLSQESIDANQSDASRSIYVTDIYQKDQQIQEMTKYIADLQNNLTYFQQALVDKEAELDNVHRRLLEAERVQSSLTSNQKSFEKILQQKEQELEILNKKWMNTKQNLEESYSEQDTNYNHYQLLENEKTELEGQIQEMKKHHGEMSSYSEGLWNELGELKLVYETLMSEKEDLELQLIKQTKEAEDVEIKLSEIQKTETSLRLEKDKLDIELSQIKQDYESEILDREVKAAKIIQLNEVVAKMEENASAFKVNLAKKDVLIEEIVDKLNIEQDVKSKQNTKEQQDINHLEQELQKSILKIADLSETCHIQKSNMEITKQLMVEKDTTIEHLQQKTFDTQSVVDLHAVLDQKEQKIDDLMNDVENQNVKISSLQQSFMVVQEENAVLKEQIRLTQKEILEQKQLKEDMEHQLTMINHELHQVEDQLLEKDWSIHELQKTSDSVKKIMSEEQQEQISRFTREIEVKQLRFEELNLLVAGLQTDLQSAHNLVEEKIQETDILSQEKNSILMEYKSWNVKEEHLNSVFRLKDQEIHDLNSKLTTIQEYNSKMDIEFKNLYTKEQDYITKCQYQSELIQDLQTKLTETEATRNTHEDMVSNLNNQLLELRAQPMDSQHSEVAKLKANVKKRDAKILTLNKKLKETENTLNRVSKDYDEMKTLVVEAPVKPTIHQRALEPFVSVEFTEELIVGNENTGVTASQSQTGQLADKESNYTNKTAVVQSLTESNMLNKNETVTQAYDDVQKNVVQLQATIDSKESLIHKDENIQQPTETISEMNVQLQNYSQTATDLQEQLHAKDLNQDDLSGKLNNSDEQINLLMIQLQHQSELNRDSEDKMSQVENKLKEAQDLVVSLQSELQLCNHQLNKSMEKQQEFQLKERTLEESLQMSIVNQQRISQVSKELEESKILNVSLQSDLQKSYTEIDKLMVKQQEYQLSKQTLEQSLQAMEVNQAIENTQLFSVQSQLDAANCKLEQLQGNSSDKDKEMVDITQLLNQQLQNKTDDMVNLQTKLEQSHKFLKEANDSLEMKQEKISSLLDNLQEMESRLSQIENIEETSESINQELQRTKNALIEKEKLYDEKILILKKAIATAKKLKFQLQRSDEKIKELEESKEEESKFRIELENQVKLKVSELGNLQTSMQHLQEASEVFDNNKLEEIKKELQSYTEYSQQLQEQVQQLKEAIFSSEQVMKQKQSELDNLEGESTNLKLETEELKAAYERLQEETETLKELEESYKSTMIKNKEHTLNLSKQIEELDSEYLLLRQQLSEKDDQYNSLISENERLFVIQQSLDGKMEELSMVHKLLEKTQFSNIIQVFENLEATQTVLPKQQEGEFVQQKHSDESEKLIEDLKDQVQQKDVCILDIQKQMETLKININSDDNTLVEISDLKTSLGCLQDTTNALKKEKDELVSKLEMTSQDLQTLQESLQRSHLEKAEMESKLGHIGVEMQESLNGKDKEIQVYVESLNNLQQKEEVLQESIKKLKDVLQKTESEESQMMSQLNELIQENQLLKSEAEKSFKESSQPQPSLDDRLTESLSASNMECESLKLKCEELQTEKISIQKLNNQLQAEKDTIKEEFEMQIGIVENLQHLLKEKQVTIEELHGENERLNTRINDLTESNEKQQKEIESLQGQYEGLEQILTASQMTETDVKNQYTDLKTDFEKTLTDNKKLFEELNRLKAVEFVEKIEVPLIKEVLHQTSAHAPLGAETGAIHMKEQYYQVEKDNDRVKAKLQITEVKCEKMLYKLKAFKDKNDKLLAEMDILKKRLHVRNDSDDVNDIDSADRIEKLELINAGYKSDLESKTKQFHELLEENKDLKENISSQNNKLKSLEEDIFKKSDDFDKLLCNERKQFEKHVRNLEQNLKDVNNINVEMLEENNLVISSRQTITEELKAAETDVKNFHVHIEALTFREESLNLRLAEQVNISQVLKNKIEDAEAELAILRPFQNELTDIKAQHDQSLSDLNENFTLESKTLKNKLENLQEQYNMLEADNQEFIILSDNLRETVRKLKKEHEEKTFLLNRMQEDSTDTSLLTGRICNLESERDVLHKQVADLRTDLFSTTEKREEINLKQQELEKQLIGYNDLKEKLIDLESERDELVNEMEGLREDMINARKEKQATKEEIENLKQKVENLATEDNDVQKCHADVEILRIDNHSLKDQIDGLNWKLEEACGFEEELQEVQKQLDNMEREKSSQQSISSEELDLRIQELKSVQQEMSTLKLKSEKQETIIQNLTSELRDANDKINKLTEAEQKNKSLQEELEEAKMSIVKLNRQSKELNVRLESLDALEVEFSELNEQYNKSLNDNNDMAKQIEDLRDRLQQLNNVEKEISLTVEQKDHFAREKETLQQRVNDLESQGTNVTDENAHLKQQLEQLKSSVQQLTFEGNTLKSQLQIVSSSGDQMSKFQSEYDNLQQQFNLAIEQKNKSLADLNEAHYNHQHREQRCQQLAMQVSQLAEDRSYLNAQLGHLSKSLREKESEWSTMKSQYRSLYQTHMSTQMKVADLEKKVVTETFQKAHAYPTTSVPGHVIPDQSQLEEYKQRLEASEKLKEQAIQTMTGLQQKLQAEEKRSEQIEKTLKDAQDQLLLQASKSLQEVKLLIEEDDNDSRIREYNPMLTRHGMGYCRRLQRWMKVKKQYFSFSSRQLSRMMRLRPGIRKCLWAYFFVVHILIVACVTGFL